MHQDKNLTLPQEIFPQLVSIHQFLAKFVLHMRRNSYFRDSGQHSDITITFSDPSFLKESSNLAIRRRLRVFFFTVRLVICHISISDRLT